MHEATEMWDPETSLLQLRLKKRRFGICQTGKGLPVPDKSCLDGEAGRCLMIELEMCTTAFLKVISW